MSTQYTDLIADLRSRINPLYAAMPGTESYERRLCAEALEAQAEEIQRLRKALECYDLAIKEAEAILGGEYAMSYGPFFDLVEKAKRLR